MAFENGRRLFLGSAAAVALAFSAAYGQQPGAAERVGEKIDEAASGVKRAVGRAGETVKEQFARAKASINAMGVESRVYGRIRWDKDLQSATIDIGAQTDGTVTLTGTVADAAAKAKAVRLAAETVGVARVVDRLTTPPASADR